MALVDFERWLDNKIEYFKRKGTVVLGGEDWQEDTEDPYGGFEMAEAEAARQLTDQEDFSSDSEHEVQWEEPELEFDETDLKGSDYYKFVWNDEDEDDLFDRASLNVPIPKYQDNTEVSDGPVGIHSDPESDMVESGLGQDTDATKLESWDYEEDLSVQDAEYRREGDGQSFPGSCTELPGVAQGEDGQDADFTLAQVSDDSNQQYRRIHPAHRMPMRPTLPMDSTYLSMDEDTNDDDDMLQDVRFDDYEGTEVPPDTRPIMVEERTLRALHADKVRLLKKAVLFGAIFFCLAVFGVVVFVIWKLAQH